MVQDVQGGLEVLEVLEVLVSLLESLKLVVLLPPLRSSH